MKTLKNIFTLLFLGVTIGVSAQTTTKTETSITNKTINDDGKTLQIKVTGIKNEKAFKFDKTYNVKGLSKAQREAIKKHVIDFLGVN